MRKTALFVAAALALGSAARASDPIGVYAVIDKVVLEPKEDKAERAQVWGVFALAQGRGGDNYAEPARGYMYFSLVTGKEDACRKEWADLKKVAGTGQGVGFASRYKPQGAVRKGGDKPDKPDEYPLGFGVQKVRDDHPLAKDMRAMPAPLGPADGAEVEPGAVTLRVQKVVAKEREKARYVFEVENSAGTKETSPPVIAGEAEAKWSPKMAVKAGEKYTWRVWAMDDKWTGPVTTLTFKGKAAR